MKAAAQLRTQLHPLLIVSQFLVREKSTGTPTTSAVFILIIPQCEEKVEHFFRTM